MNRKIISMVCSMCMLIASISTLSVSAIEKTVTNEETIDAAGLITSYSLSISKSGTTLYINAETGSDSIMKSIGFKNIVVECSYDGNNWSTYNPIGNILDSNSSVCYLDDYSVYAENGYYYRVTLTHYAKEMGLFGSSQSVPNVSNVVW